MQGKRIVSLDLRELNDAPASYFVICSGESRRKIQAISERIEEYVKEETGTRPVHIEGQENKNWVLIDYFNVVVHIFHPTARDFYELDELWGDAQIVMHTDE